MGKIFIILFLCVSSISFSQIDKNKVRSHVMDASNELEGKLTLHFMNALTGKPIPNAKVTIENIGSFTTDFKGRVFFETDEMDAHPVVTFTHPDYITSKFEIQIAAGTIIFNRFSVSPIMRVGSIRIVLDWGREPRDLDAHLVKEGGYHISYRNKKVASDGAAKLDRDDVDSFGPETITINVVDQNAHYLYFVHDYTNRNNSADTKLADSHATVKVYEKNKGLLYVLSVPSNFVGNKWKVFEIVNGKIRLL